MRYLPERPLPATAYVPGRTAKPAAEPPLRPLAPEHWREDDGYLWGVDLYNGGFPWEAHEVWEGMWRTAAGPQRELLQGLIQVAAAGVKIAAGEPEPAIRLTDRASGRLLAVGNLMGVDAPAFARVASAWTATRPRTLEGHPLLVLPLRRVLSSPRLHVRELEWDDLEAMAGLCAKPVAMRFVGDNQPLSYEQVRRWIARSIENYRLKPHGFGVWAACSREDGGFVGYAGIVYPEGEPELIYTLEPAFWGQGLGTELAGAVLAHALSRVERVIATVDPANQASRKILAGLGFVHEKTGVDEHGLPTQWWSVTR